ncbi:hypothetical protein [Aquimarina sp. MMG016]|uniref:hypothetical protein n=1 Tax=Aquimarina sp. MMG016 TaxID=2822690 RepID=UPI001B3A078C|nr:hypothetical protein [Aquimarina sp. MMG016]MBQ4821248.1 hypothetical protein [Aquimarina sp. MMG016]
MIKLYSYIILLMLILSCSEGDVIQDNIDFLADLESCSNGNNFVFYKIDDDINRSLSVNFTSTSFDITPQTDDISVDEPTIFTLSSSNQLIYRQFNSPINGQDYFCSSIPPSNISVTEELISTNGSLEISYTALPPSTDGQDRFTRTVTLKNVTFVGERGIIRKENLLLGSEEIIITN